MYGSSLTLKKSLLLSFLSFMPLPVSTLAASILMSMTPVKGSVEVNVMVASHFVNVPSIGTDAFTPNLIVLCIGVILKTGTPAGAWARLADGIHMSTTTQRVSNRISLLLYQEMKRQFAFTCQGLRRLVRNQAEPRGSQGVVATGKEAPPCTSTNAACETTCEHLRRGEKPSLAATKIQVVVGQRLMVRSGPGKRGNR